MNKVIQLTISGVLTLTQVSNAQINLGVKVPKFGKKNETPTTSPKQESTTSTPTPQKKETAYFFTNYTASFANAKEYKLNKLEMLNLEDSYIKMHLNMLAEDGSKMDENYFEHSKVKDQVFYENTNKNTFIFKLTDGSYLLTNKSIDNVKYMTVNLFSVDESQIKNAPSRENLVVIATDLVQKAEYEKLKPELAKLELVKVAPDLYKGTDKLEVKQKITETFLALDKKKVVTISFTDEVWERKTGTQFRNESSSYENYDNSFLHFYVYIENPKLPAIVDCYYTYIIKNNLKGGKIDYSNIVANVYNKKENMKMLAKNIK